MPSVLFSAAFLLRGKRLFISARLCFFTEFPSKREPLPSRGSGSAINIIPKKHALPGDSEGAAQTYRGHGGGIIVCYPVGSFRGGGKGHFSGTFNGPGMFAVFLGQCHGKPGGSGAGRIRVCSGEDAVTRFQGAGRGDFVGYAVAVRHHDGAVCFQRLRRGHGG